MVFNLTVICGVGVYEEVLIRRILSKFGRFSIGLGDMYIISFRGRGYADFL